jgi:hypothetical protein
MVGFFSLAAILMIFGNFLLFLEKGKADKAMEEQKSKSPNQSESPKP